MNKEITPIIDEVYWKIYQVYHLPYSYNFVLSEIFHFNSLTCTDFLSTRSPYEQLKKSIVYIPERIIQDNNCQLFLKYKNQLIKKEIPFIQNVDDCKWIVNKKIIKENENSLL